MEIITQNPLLPETAQIHWIMLPPETWDYKAPDTVWRETEDSAFDQIQHESRLFTLARMITLTPMHRRVAQRESELMQRYSHYTMANCIRDIASEMQISDKRVKKLLMETSIVYKLLMATGMEELLEAA